MPIDLQLATRICHTLLLFLCQGHSRRRQLWQCTSCLTSGFCFSNYSTSDKSALWCWLVFVGSPNVHRDWPSKSLEVLDWWLRIISNIFLKIYVLFRVCTYEHGKLPIISVSWTLSTDFRKKKIVMESKTNHSVKSSCLILHPSRKLKLKINILKVICRK